MSLTRRSLFKSLLSAAAGCVLARTAFLGPRVEANTLQARMLSAWERMEKMPPLAPPQIPEHIRRDLDRMANLAYEKHRDQGRTLLTHYAFLAS